MTQHNDALKQMRSANPLVGTSDVDADELSLSRSHFEERRLAMTTRTPTPVDRARTTNSWSRRPVLIAASAFVLIIALLGAGTIMLRGTEVDMFAAEGSETAITTVVKTPTVTTTPEEPVVAVPEASTIESGVRILSSVPEYGTNLVLGSDGLPMFLSTTRSGDEYPGTARLFRCTDVACDDFTTEILEYGPGSAGQLRIGGGSANDQLVVAPNGDVYITLESADASQSIGRYDGDTVEPLPAMSSWGGMPYTPLPAAFDDIGNPIFVVFAGEVPATIDLLMCKDPLCGDFAQIEIDSDFDIPSHFPAVFIDGNDAQVVYGIGQRTGPIDPETGGDGAEAVFQTKVATVTDLQTSPNVSTRLIYEGLNAYLSDSAITDRGEPVAWIWQWLETETPGEPSQSIITVVCGDQACNDFVVGQDEAVDLLMIAEIDSQMRVVSAHFEEIYDPDEYAAYLKAQAAFEAAVVEAADEEGRTFPEDIEGESPPMPEQLGTNIVVTRCSDTTCTSVKRTTIAAFAGPAWYLDSLELEVAPDGTVLVAVASVGELSEPGLQLYVFPDGEFGPGVEPITGHAVDGWGAR